MKGKTNTFCTTFSHHKKREIRAIGEWDGGRRTQKERLCDRGGLRVQTIGEVSMKKVGELKGLKENDLGGNDKTGGF